MTDPRAPARTVFLGSGAFAVPILDVLLRSPDVLVTGVVSAPDRPAGRGGTSTPVPVASRAREVGLPLLQPLRVRAPEARQAIAALSPDVGVLADYGQIIPAELLELPPHGILNVHPSLLPRHRGATPIAATILAGDTEGGVTVFLMDAGLDSGPIVAQERWALDGTETAPLLENLAARRGAALLHRSLSGWLAGSVPARAQSDVGMTMTRPLKREDGRLDPTRSAIELERQVRAYQPWPGSFLETEAGRLIVWRATALDPRPDVPDPGVLVADGDGVALIAVDGVLRLNDVQLAARTRMTSSELRRGHPRLIGSRVR